MMTIISDKVYETGRGDCVSQLSPKTPPAIVNGGVHRVSYSA